MKKPSPFFNIISVKVTTCTTFLFFQSYTPWDLRTCLSHADLMQAFSQGKVWNPFKILLNYYIVSSHYYYNSVHKHFWRQCMSWDRNITFKHVCTTKHFYFGNFRLVIFLFCIIPILISRLNWLLSIMFSHKMKGHWNVVNYSLQSI